MWTYGFIKGEMSYMSLMQMHETSRQKGYEKDAPKLD